MNIDQIDFANWLGNNQFNDSTIIGDENFPGSNKDSNSVVIGNENLRPNIRTKNEPKSEIGGAD